MGIELSQAWIGLVAVLLAVVAAACGGPAPAAAPTPPASPGPLVRAPASPSPGVSPAPSVRAPAPAPSVEPRAAPLVQQAVADAAQRTGLAPSAVRVVQVEAREWRDASLGCPRPGRMYAQVLTPGYLIVLEAAGQRLEYHADGGRRVELCS